MAASDTIDIAANRAFMTTGAAQAMISSGSYRDSSGVYHTIYPDGHTWWPLRHHHHHHYSYPWRETPLQMGAATGAGSSEKPHETVQRAIRVIAHAARELARSADLLGVPVDERALEEALIEKLRDAL